MEKCEYMFLKLDKWHPQTTLAALNEAGQQGWEVVSHYWGRFTLKRRVH